MAITLRRWCRFEVTTDQGQTIWGGNKLTDKPNTISLAGEAYLDLRKAISASSVWDAWTTGGEEPLTDFDYLFCETDLDDVHIELTTDTGAQVGTVVATVPVDKNHPFELCSDDAFANYTADWATGTLDVIDQIRIRNNDGSSTANVRLFLAT